MGKNKKRAKVPERPELQWIDYVLPLIPALLIGGLRTFARPCVHTDGSSAACTKVGYVLLILGVVGVAMVIMRLLAADKATRRSFDLFLLVLGVVVALVPDTILSLCADLSMRCHTVMQPFARVAGGLQAVVALLCEAGVDHEEPTGRRRRR